MNLLAVRFDAGWLYTNLGLRFCGNRGMNTLAFCNIESWMNLLAARSAPAFAVSAKLLAPKVCQVHHEGIENILFS